MKDAADNTLFIGNLDGRVNEKVLYEIMVQAGPLADIYIPRDKETQQHKGFAFVRYTSEDSARYALTLFTGLVSLYNRPLRFAISSRENKSLSQQVSYPHREDNDNNPLVGEILVSRPVETDNRMRRRLPPLPNRHNKHPSKSAKQKKHARDNLSGQDRYHSITTGSSTQSCNEKLLGEGDWSSRLSSCGHAYYSALSY